MSGCGIIPNLQKGGGATVSPVTVTQPITASVGNPAPQPVQSRSDVVLGVPSATITQPENPKGASGQNVSYERVVTSETPVDVVEKTTTSYADGTKVVVERPIPRGTLLREHVKQNVDQKLGGSFMDTARDVAAKLAAYSKLQYIGVGLIIFAMAGLFYAPLRTILGGGKQFPIAIGALGSLLIIAPMLIVGNEGLILGGAVIIGGITWLVIRLSHKEGIQDANAIKTPPK